MTTTTVAQRQALTVPPAAAGADRHWRRLVQRIDPAHSGAFALDGQHLDAGADYHIGDGAIVICCDMIGGEYHVRMLTVTGGAWTETKTWTQKNLIGARIVGYISRRLPARTDPATPAEAPANRFSGHCWQCRQDVPAGTGRLITRDGRRRVAHRGACPPRPPRANAYGGTCRDCTRHVAAGEGILVETPEDPALGRPGRYEVRHRRAEDCAAAPLHAPNRSCDWCVDCLGWVRAGRGVWRDGAVHHDGDAGCGEVPALPMWRISRRSHQFAEGSTFRARFTPRPGDRPVPDGTPGYRVLDERLVTAVITVVDARKGDHGGGLALVRAATWEEAGPILAEEAGQALDAIPVGSLFAASWQAERIGPSAIRMLQTGGYSPWMAEIVGHSREHGLERRFLRPSKDYTRANSRGTRGVEYHWILYPNRVYEASYRLSWSRARRVFLRVTADGDTEEITREQVDAWLAHAAEWVGVDTSVKEAGCGEA